MNTTQHWHNPSMKTITRRDIHGQFCYVFQMISEDRIYGWVCRVLIEGNFSACTTIDRLLQNPTGRVTRTSCHAFIWSSGFLRVGPLAIHLAARNRRLRSVARFDLELMLNCTPTRYIQLALITCNEFHPSLRPQRVTGQRHFFTQVYYRVRTYVDHYLNRSISIMSWGGESLHRPQVVKLTESNCYSKIHFFIAPDCITCF